MTLTPVFRLEYFITAAANGTPCDLEPVFNEEKYLHAIAGASVELPMPVGRTQEYLAKLAGMDVEIPDHPIFRTEYYLAHMIDSTIECPAPIYREEMFYYEWAAQDYVTVTGNPVSFYVNHAAPLRKLQVAFSPVQSGSGDPSPDNVRPISGWSSLGVEQRGKNLLNPAGFAEWCTVTGDVVTYNGDMATGAANSIKVPCFIPKGKTISLSCVAVSGATLWRPKFFNANNVQIWDSGAYRDIASRENSVTLTDDAAYFSCGIKEAAADGYMKGSVKFQIEYGSTATAYVPYNPLSRSISISLGETVYSGTLDVLTGVLTVTHQLFTFGADDVANWVQSSAGTHYFTRRRPTGFSQTTTTNWNIGFYSNFLGATERSASASSVKDNGFYTGSSYLVCRSDSIADIDAFKTLITATPLQIVSPITEAQIQLTPQEVSTLLGNNMVWSDLNGDLTVEYQSN